MSISQNAQNGPDIFLFSKYFVLFFKKDGEITKLFENWKMTRQGILLGQRKSQGGCCNFTKKKWRRVWMEHQASSHNFLSVLFGILGIFGIGIYDRKKRRRKISDWKNFRSKNVWKNQWKLKILKIHFLHDKMLFLVWIFFLTRYGCVDSISGT